MIKETNDSWHEFMETLSDQDDESILDQVKCPLSELLDKQATIDRVKKALFKPEIGKLLKLYLSRISIHDLSVKMKSHEKIFRRAFGVDKHNHLKLLVCLKMLEEEKKPKRGLLAI